MLALGTFQPQLTPTDWERFRSLASDVIPPRIQTDTAEENNILNVCQFCFRARHSTTFLCMRLTDRVTLTFNNDMFTAAVVLDIEKAFDTT